MFQIVLTALTAFAIVWLLGPLLLPLLQRLKPAQQREIMPEPEPPISQKKKQPVPQKAPVPTMGGLFVLLAISVAPLIFGLDGMEFALPAVVATVALGVLGFVDDFIRVRGNESVGLREYQKLFVEFIVALVVAVWAYRSPLIGSAIQLPLSGGEWDLGFWYVPLVIITILLQTNAAQRMDDMDGLVTGLSAVYSLFMVAIFAALARAANQTGEFLLGGNLEGGAVFAAAVGGAGIGFLRYNTYPARLQAGSTGSLALGGAVAMIAILSRSFLILPLMGFGFTLTMISVVLQAVSLKREDGRRLFRAAPLHRHFELSGQAAPRIVSMYTIFTAALSAVCLLLYLK
ncbi:Phospho-N-acetylmuramoyl-pentapeptide-transferase [bioreactor metagenome]|uniref:Phospho-N-acetylmuramoyl-pentapeptide-transferase n=1 Tax=bioreactor metagenome TaxID=1076179 RepID=A0A644Z9U4_9ZZZZ|nr:phospho-N-acetylmuramoyl-pentapeptide-transferase [Christensenella sp.]